MHIQTQYTWLVQCRIESDTDSRMTCKKYSFVSTVCICKASPIDSPMFSWVRRMINILLKQVIKYVWLLPSVRNTVSRGPWYSLLLSGPDMQRLFFEWSQHTHNMCYCHCTYVYYIYMCNIHMYNMYNIICIVCAIATVHMYIIHMYSGNSTAKHRS